MLIKRVNKKIFLKLSLIIPVYIKTTKKNFIECFFSVINQKYLPKQILVCVDGPIKSSLKKYIILLKNKKKIDTFYKEQNIGLGKILREAVIKSRYNLIARLDSDDICLNNRFIIQYKFLKKNKDIVMIGGWIDEVNKNKIIFKKVLPKSFREIKEYAIFRNPINHPTVMFRKDKILEVGNYEHQPFFEDYLLWIKLINKNKKIVNLDHSFVKMNIDENFYKRRSGFIYYLMFVQFQLKVYALNFINAYQLTINIFLRLILILPFPFNKLLYKTILRND
jgi:hypothetical protein